jgi:hypothetical protein
MWTLLTPRRARFTPGKNVPIVHEDEWVSVETWTGRKISPPPASELRYVQLAASRFTDWAIPAIVSWSLLTF